MNQQRLLLLSPSSGLGGGIERVMSAVETHWTGPVARVDLMPLDEAARSKLRPDGTVSRTAIADFAARALKAAHESRADVVFCGLLGLLPVASAVALTRRCKLALLAHGVEVWVPLGPAERMLIRRCSRVLAVSSFTATMLSRRAGLDPGDVQVLPLPMADPLAAAAQHPVGAHAGRQPVVLTVSRIARIDRFKGHFDIARCFVQVLERRPDARWIVVGDGDDLGALQAESRRLGIERAVTFTGRISDAELTKLYRSAALFALPSFTDINADPPAGEGFGLVYAEAGAFGLPIIGATPGGGSADFVLHNQTGITVKPHATDELTDAIVRLLDDSDLRTALGQRARDRALGSHLPEHFRVALNASLR